MLDSVCHTFSNLLRRLLSPLSSCLEPLQLRQVGASLLDYRPQLEVVRRMQAVALGFGRQLVDACSLHLILVLVLLKLSLSVPEVHFYLCQAKCHTWVIRERRRFFRLELEVVLVFRGDLSFQSFTALALFEVGDSSSLV